MLLQELFKEENNKLTEAYSIKINEESSAVEYSTPPSNLKEIGFIFKIGEDGLMDEKFLDLIISYGLTNLPVLIEVPSQLLAEEKITAKYLIQLANNVGFSIAILPPGHQEVGSSITIEQYKNVVMQMTDEMLKKPNFDKFVYPVSNYFEYLMLEQILGKEKLANFRPESEYIKDNFSSIMTHKDSDEFKLEIRNRLYDFYGGEQEFNLVAQTILDGVYEKSKEMFTEIVENLVPEYVGTNGFLPGEGTRKNIAEHNKKNKKIKKSLKKAKEQAK